MTVDILDDFLLLTEKGLYCPYGNFYVDAKYPVSTCVISHAHGDHAIAGHGSVYCSGATRDLMEARFGKKAAGRFHCLSYGEGFEVQGVRIRFLPAGHILGSCQVLLEYKGVKYLYTGDYKLQQDATCEPIALEEAQVLITESTFANPSVAHPDPVQEIRKLNDIKTNIMLGTYAMGKAQRLTDLINKECPGKTVLVHRAIAPFHHVYAQHGVRHLRYALYTRKAMKEKNEGIIYMVPPITFNSYIRAKDVVRVFASGWKHLHRGNQQSLYVSDHVDWEDILWSVSKIKPRQIWTLHGNGHYLKQHFDGQLTVKIL